MLQLYGIFQFFDDFDVGAKLVRDKVVIRYLVVALENQYDFSMLQLNHVVLHNTYDCLRVVMIVVK
jgi:hypothetical protein